MKGKIWPRNRDICWEGWNSLNYCTFKTKRTDCLSGSGLHLAIFFLSFYWLKNELNSFLKLASLLSVDKSPLYRTLVHEKSYSTMSTKFEKSYLYARKKLVWSPDKPVMPGKRYYRSLWAQIHWKEGTWGNSWEQSRNSSTSKQA